MTCLRELDTAQELRSHPHKFLITVSHRPALSVQGLESLVGLLDLLKAPAARGPALARIFLHQQAKGFLNSGGVVEILSVAQVPPIQTAAAEKSMHTTQPRDRTIVVLRALIAVFVALMGCASQVPYVWVDQYTPPAGTNEQSTEYRLAPGDTIGVRVFNQDGMNTSARIRADGKVSLPLVNDVSAEGLTPTEFGKKVASVLREYINQPVVTVLVETMHATEVSVVGEVGRPGVYPIERGQGVLRAIAAAGGVTQFAHKDRIYVLRQTSPLRIRLKMDELETPGTPAARFQLLPNDAIVVE